MEAYRHSPLETGAGGQLCQQPTVKQGGYGPVTMEILYIIFTSEDGERCSDGCLKGSKGCLKGFYTAVLFCALFRQLGRVDYKSPQGNVVFTVCSWVVACDVTPRQTQSLLFYAWEPEMSTIVRELSSR